MDIAKLRQRIQLQSLVPVQDPVTGAITPTWANFGPEIWAAVEPLSAAEFIAAANQNSKITLKLVIRYLAGVLPSMRALHGTRVYQLAGALPDKKYGNEFLVLPCSEVVSG